MTTPTHHLPALDAVGGDERVMGTCSSCINWRQPAGETTYQHCATHNRREGWGSVEFMPTEPHDTCIDWDMADEKTTIIDAAFISSLEIPPPSWSPSPLPEGHDSAEGIQREAASPAEVLRIRRARAVAKRSVMMDMAHMCDAKAKAILAANPGRSRGGSSIVGVAMAAVAKSLGDEIEAMREGIEVP